MLVRKIPRLDVGTNYTYPIRFYNVPDRPGWDVFRLGCGYYILPPGFRSWYGSAPLSLMLQKSNSSQLRKFEDNCAVKLVKSTTHCTTEGLYNDGKNNFYLSKYSAAEVTAVEICIHGTWFTGIRIITKKDERVLDYVLLVDKGVDICQFYKYLLFYRGYVSKHVLEGDPVEIAHLPYPTDKRLEGYDASQYTTIQKYICNTEKRG